MDHQLIALQKAGITDVAMVVGYRREQIMETARELFPDFNFSFIVNHHFFDTNTAYSLWLARQYFLDQDFIYMNGDVLFPPAILHRILNMAEGNWLAVDTKSCGDEEVKVVTKGDGDRIIDIGKELQSSSARGEFLGIARFSPGFTPDFSATLGEIVEAGLNSAYFEYALKKLAQSHTLNVLDVSDLPCIEIDFPEDLHVAQSLAMQPEFSGIFDV